MVLDTYGGWPQNRERYIYVHICNSPNYSDTDQNRDIPLYNMMFSYEYLLLVTNDIKCSDELRINYNSTFED